MAGAGHAVGTCPHKGISRNVRAEQSPQDEYRSPSADEYRSESADFIDRIRESERRRKAFTTPVKPPQRGTSDAHAAVRGVAQAVANEPKGDGNAITNWAAYVMREHVKDGSLGTFKCENHF
jgi:hypothetical protein